MHNKFKVRKWTDDKLQARPYDVVYLDLANNNMHFQPDMLYSNEVDAAVTVEKLNKAKQAANPKQWPIHGPIPDDYLH